MLSVLHNHCQVEYSGEGTKDFPENYYPVPNLYIVFQTGSEKPSQVYNKYFEVIGQIGKYLEERKIVPIQIGDPSDPFVPNTLDLRGKLSPRQIAFLVKNSLVCITSHGFAARLCRTYDVPLVLIGCNFPMKSTLESFTNEIVYLEPELEDGKKWNYKVEDSEFPANRIGPEKICSAILKFLAIEHSKFPETIFIGKYYGSEMFDFVPDGPFPRHLIGKSLNLRLDLFFNSESLQILDFCKCNVVTRKSFDINNINISNIISIAYFCDEELDVEFVKNVISKGINIKVICNNEDKIKDYRFSLLGITEVFKKKYENPLDKLETYATMFRSSRVIFGRNKVYPSIYHYKNDISSNLIEMQTPVIDEDFLEYIDFIYIFKK